MQRRGIRRPPAHLLQGVRDNPGVSAFDHHRLTPRGPARRCAPRGDVVTARNLHHGQAAAATTPTAVRTGGPGRGGVSLLVIEGDTAGIVAHALKKMGWWASDTATLHFDDCRVPAGNLLGEEGAGFKIIMHNFNGRAADHGGRLHRRRAGLPRRCDRIRQAPPHLENPWRSIRSSGTSWSTWRSGSRRRRRCWKCWRWRLDQGENPVAEICMLKNQATKHGILRRSGTDFWRRRFYRGIKANASTARSRSTPSGGGSEEIMKDSPPGRWDCEPRPFRAREARAGIHSHEWGYGFRPAPSGASRNERKYEWGTETNDQRSITATPPLVSSALDAGRTRSPYDLKMLPFPPARVRKDYLAINPLGTIVYDRWRHPDVGIVRHLPLSRHAIRADAAGRHVEEPAYGAF